MKNHYTTHSTQETRDLASAFAKTLRGGDVVLLEGDLGSGKTTFAQGLLEALGAEKPYTSPTFVICKSYAIIRNAERGTRNAQSDFSDDPRSAIRVVQHLDTYRITSKDLLDLGWNEMIADPHAVTLLEWPERVRDILPETAKKIFFAHKGEDVREIQWKNSYSEE